MLLKWIFLNMPQSVDRQMTNLNISKNIEKKNVHPHSIEYM